MNNAQVLWTILPRSRGVSGIGLTIYYSFRLRGGLANDQLRSWSACLDWPTTLLGLIAQPLTLTFQGSSGSPLVLPAVVSGAQLPSSELWSAIFNEETPVRSHVFDDHFLRPLRSYPLEQINGFLERVYAMAALGPGHERPFITGPKAEQGLFDALLGARDCGARRPATPTDTGSGDGSDASKEKGKRHGVGAGTVRDSTKNGEGRPDSTGSGKPEKPPELLAVDFGSVLKSAGACADKIGFDYLKGFYRRSAHNEYLDDDDAPDLSELPDRIAPPDFDFHDAVSLLSDHPSLLRRLGLVIDLEVDLSGAQLPPEGIVRVASLGSAGSGITHTFAATAYSASHDGFVARPRPAGADGTVVVDGMLALGNSQVYRAYNVDVDGGGLKVLQTAATVERLHPAPAGGGSRVQSVSPLYGPIEEEGLPALRGTGITVAQRNRAFRLAGRLQSNKALNAAIEASVGNSTTFPLFFADDLHQGYRVDVLDLDAPNGAWRSLCEREADYRIGTETFSVVEEGYVKVDSASGATEANGADGSAASGDLYLHEALFAWNGWSLVAEPPGRAITQHTYDDDGRPVEVSSEAARVSPPSKSDRFNITTVTRAKPGSLPRLRFGHRYRFRARMVDIAGNSRTLDDPALSDVADIQTDPVLYPRWEPVASPTLVPTAPFSRGESLEQLVIRSDVGSSVTEYSMSAHVRSAVASGDEPAFAETSERHVVPPIGSQQLAELHGHFDAAMGASGDPEHYFKIAVKEEGRLTDTLIVNTATGEPEIDVSEDLRIITPPEVPAPYPTLPLPLGGSLAAGQYLVNTADILELPWLPDPIARGAAFRSLPHAVAGSTTSGETSVPSGTDFTVTRIPFELDWPEAKAFKIRIVDGGVDGSAPQWNPADRVLTINLPKGTMATVQYSSYIDSGDGDLMGVPSLLASGSDYANASARSSLIGLATFGSSWMLTPWRTLTLVHAVQRPLEAPSITSMTVKKSPLPSGQQPLGQTWATIRGQIEIDAKSTGAVDLLAKWTEPVDDLTKPGPERIDQRDPVMQLTITNKVYPQSASGKNVLPLPLDDDTVHTRYRHDFGDTKHRKVDYRLKATTRFQEFLPPRIVDHPVNKPEGEDNQDETNRISVTGPQFETVTIPNSARPDAPKILYVIPTFGWERPPITDGGEIVSRRYCGRLRVYMDRPWFSSGEGELLGVILKEGSAASLAGNPAARSYATQWGADPIWRTGPANQQYSFGAFPLATAPKRQLAFPEAPSELFTVAGHEPVFDYQRRLWYCDIQIDAGPTYMPFVRLALARYQPESIPGAHLSTVVLADCVQLAPQRVAVVTFPEARSLRIMVSGMVGENALTVGASTGGGSSPQSPRPNLDLSRAILVTVERRVQSGRATVWAPVSDGLTNVMLKPWKEQSMMVAWAGDIALPSGFVRSGGIDSTYRLSIKEYELLEADTPADVLAMKIARQQVGAAAPPTGAADRLGGRPGVAGRIVYADIINL